MREIVALRQEEVALLGYANFAEVSLVRPRWPIAGRGHAVPARPGPPRPPLCREGPGRAARVRRQGAGPGDLQAWDIPFASEKLKEARYAFSDQEVKQYFTAPKVVAGLFSIIERVFHVQIREARRRCGTSRSASSS